MHVVAPAPSSDLPTVYFCLSLTKIYDESRETKPSWQREDKFHGRRVLSARNHSTWASKGLHDLLLPSFDAIYLVGAQTAMKHLANRQAAVAIARKVRQILRFCERFPNALELGDVLEIRHRRASEPVFSPIAFAIGKSKRDNYCGSDSFATNFADPGNETFQKFD